MTGRVPNHVVFRALFLVGTVLLLTIGASTAFAGVEMSQGDELVPDVLMTTGPDETLEVDPNTPPVDPGLISVNAGPGTQAHGAFTGYDEDPAIITTNGTQASIIFNAQPSPNGNYVLIEEVSGQQGQQIAIWSTDEDGNPDKVIGNRALRRGSEENILVSLDDPLEEGNFDLISAVHGTTDPANITTGNIIASALAQVASVTVDQVSSSSSVTPTVWRGQTLLLEGDFLGDVDYQIRGVLGCGQNRTVGGVAREVRAPIDNYQTVSTDLLDAGLFITETETKRYSKGDELAPSLDDEPGFGYEIAVQDMGVRGVQEQVGRNQTFNVGLIDSTRSSYDINVTAVDADGESFFLTRLPLVAGHEMNTAIRARYLRDNGSTAPLPIDEYTLLFNVTDTLASDSATLEVTAGETESSSSVANYANDDGIVVIDDPSVTPTVWRGQTLRLEGDFFPGIDYQVREVSDCGQTRAVGGIGREVRSFTDNNLTVSTDLLDASLFITETDTKVYSEGDELASSLDDEPGFGYEVVTQTLDVSNVQPQVTIRETFNVGVINSIRSSYDLTVTAVDEDGNEFALTTLKDISDREENVSINAVSGSDPLPTGEYTLLFNVTDALASDSATLEVTASVANYANDDGIVDDNGLFKAIDDWRPGTIRTLLLLDVIDAWRSGDPVT